MHDSSAAPQPSAPAPMPRPKTSGLAVTAFVISCAFFLPFVPLIGAILGIIATATLAGRKDRGGMGLAIAAIPVGFVMAFFLQGMLAAIAIPAFVKYTRKAKSIEATEGLEKLRAGARSYAQAKHYHPDTGAVLPPGFPRADTGWVPATPCCQQASAPRCTPDPQAWAGSPWRDLHFQMADGHHFQWRYSGGGPTFEAEARADLDCDSTYSSFKLKGTIGQDGEIAIQGPLIEDELE